MTSVHESQSSPFKASINLTKVPDNAFLQQPEAQSIPHKPELTQNKAQNPISALEELAGPITPTVLKKTQETVTQTFQPKSILKKPISTEQKAQIVSDIHEIVATCKKQLLLTYQLTDALKKYRDENNINHTDFKHIITETFKTVNLDIKQKENIIQKLTPSSKFAPSVDKRLTYLEKTTQGQSKLSEQEHKTNILAILEDKTLTKKQKTLNLQKYQSLHHLDNETLSKLFSESLAGKNIFFKSSANKILNGAHLDDKRPKSTKYEFVKTDLKEHYTPQEIQLINQFKQDIKLFLNKKVHKDLFFETFLEHSSHPHFELLLREAMDIQKIDPRKQESWLRGIRQKIEENK